MSGSASKRGWVSFQKWQRISIWCDEYDFKNFYSSFGWSSANIANKRIFRSYHGEVVDQIVKGVRGLTCDRDHPGGWSYHMLPQRHVKPFIASSQTSTCALTATKGHKCAFPSKKKRKYLLNVVLTDEPQTQQVTSTQHGSSSHQQELRLFNI